MRYSSLQKALEESVAIACREKEAAVLFSGGLDSSLIAQLAIAQCTARLYVVGMPECFDFEMAKKVANEMHWHLHEIAIRPEEILHLKKEFERITKLDDSYNASLGIPILAAAKHIRQKKVLSGLGADALFAGFSRTKRILKEDGVKGVEMDLQASLQNAQNNDYKRDSQILGHFGKRLHAPFLDEKVIKEGMKIPVLEKIKNEKDELRKWPLREMAKEIGLPELAWKGKKKALQYGSGVEKALKASESNKG